MTKRPIKNMVASVHQRLLKIAKEKNRLFHDLLQLYALERWLFRLSQSSHRGRFVLKGALLLVAWKTSSTRPTHDIDLLGRVSNDLESVRSVIADISLTSVEDDGLTFDPVSVTTEPITEDADYEGVRAKFQGRLGNSRLAMQVDIGFSDVFTPGPTMNRIKEQQLALFADHTICHTMRGNQLRLLFSTVAYVLLRALREFGLKDTPLANAQADTIRVKLLKVGVQVRVTIRKLWLALSESCPWQATFAAAFDP